MFKICNPSPDSRTSRLGPRPKLAAGRTVPRRRGRLLLLLRELIDHGERQLAIVRERPPLDQLYGIAKDFGTHDIDVIMARIVRGLRIATELEDRIVDCRASLRRMRMPKRASNPAPAPETAAMSTPESRRARMMSDKPVPSSVNNAPEDIDALLTHWPTSEEIAARVHGRPIGSVLADICRDIGIGYNKPLWWELLDAIDRHGGKYAHFTQALPRRRPNQDFFPDDRWPLPPSVPDWPSMPSPAPAEADTSPA